MDIPFIQIRVCTGQLTSRFTYPCLDTYCVCYVFSWRNTRRVRYDATRWNATTFLLVTSSGLLYGEIGNLEDVYVFLLFSLVYRRTRVLICRASFIEIQRSSKQLTPYVALHNLFAHYILLKAAFFALSILFIQRTKWNGKKFPSYLISIIFGYVVEIEILNNFLRIAIVPRKRFHGDRIENANPNRNQIHWWHSFLTELWQRFITISHMQL